MSIPQDSAIASDWRDRDPVTLDILPDEVLLKIFAFFVDETRWKDGWHLLVHVCRKWRNIVLGSPHQLNLQLVHTEKRSMKKILEVWPPLPIVIGGDYYTKSGQDNLLEALEQNERVCEIKLWFISSSLWAGGVLAKMQVPFPTLTHLDFWFADNPASVIPDSFLGGSAPRLRKLSLKGASFLRLPELLSSTHNLVELTLRNIPHSGYISPEKMVACLSRLTSLKELDLSFQSPLSRPGARPDEESQRLTRTLLPTLTDLCFDGASDYLEDFVARVDAPLLNRMAIEFFHQVRFDTPQLAQFVSRIPHFRERDEARVLFSDDKVSITLPGPFDQGLDLEVRCEQLDLQLAFVTQACGSSFPQALTATVKRLYIWYWPVEQPDNIEDSKWLQLLHPFTTAKSLHLSRGLVPCIAATLQGLAGDSEGVTKVLPDLQQLFVETFHLSESDQKAFEPFIAARQLPDRTIAISPWDGE
jgi:hypothetical protein